MPRPTVKLNQLSHFEDFSAQLYCAGASEQLCRVNGAPVASGVCHWRLPAGASVTVDDINTAAGKLRMPSDRWDPRTDGIPGEFRKYGPLAASECVRGRRLLIAGDSTTRDTFYELLAVAGHPISLNYPTNPREYWGVHDFEPRKLPTGASDAFGVCIGNYDKQLTCLRDVRWGSRNETSVLFHFLTRSNSTWELDLFSQHVGDQPLDAAFVQCPMYEWMKPDAYNYSLSRQERGKVLGPWEVGPLHFEGIGRSCREYIEHVVWRKWPRTKVFLLGMTPLPAWTREHGTLQVESIIFASIHKGLGIQCLPRPGAAVLPSAPAANLSYDLFSARAITPIDRYALVGPRRRDAIHPFFNAQFGVVQLMLNHLCRPAQLAHQGN